MSGDMKNGWNMWQVLIFPGIESCHDMGRLRQNPRPYPAAPTPMVGSGGEVADTHHFGVPDRDPGSDRDRPSESVLGISRIP